MPRFILLLCLALTLFSCSNDIKTRDEPIGVGLELANIDSTVRPQDDFFRFVNGKWIKRTVIPSDRGTWGSFNELSEFNNKAVLEVLKKAADNLKYTEGTDQRKVADFFAMGMDSSLAEIAGINPLKPTLAKIEAIKNKADLQAYLAEQQLEGGGAFFSFQVSPDSKNTSKMAAYLGSGGIGLPERDYYIKTDAKSRETQIKYREHVARMLVLIGSDAMSANKSAERILVIESQLAKGTLTKEESRDPVKQYNKKSISGLAALAPSVNWPVYFTTIGVKEDSIIVTEPNFMKEVEKIINNYALSDIKIYLKWTALRGSAAFLHHAIVQESFDFNFKYMRGVENMRPRWKRVLNATDRFLGEAIGKLYVAENFPPEAKLKAMEMVENIKLAFAERIKNVDWMSDSTKQASLKKLSTFTVKIAYPDEWKSYAGLILEKAPEKASYYQNVVNASRFGVQQNIAKLGKPVNTKEWEMTPQTVNAYYNPLFNEIVFPAGILQPPFYNYKADEAVNYGGIGAVIGHEISHGFDDQGSQYDAAGNLNNWWQADDLKNFTIRGKALADQYNKYEPLPGVFVQGQFTLGENIGDLGGMNVAYDGLQRYYREHKKPDLIDGFTPEQRFYLSWATIWRVIYKDETLRTQVNTDPHSPGMFRANGPISNSPEFYDAFGVKKGDKMFRDEKDRVRIW